MPFGIPASEWVAGVKNPGAAPVADLDNLPDVSGQKQTLLDRVVGAVEKVLPNAVSAAKGALAQLSYSGSTGNFTTAIENITLSAKFQRIVDQAPNKVGSPLYKNVYINTLSGFVLCEKPVFQSSIATAEEESAIEEFMSKGFFYE